MTPVTRTARTPGATSATGTTGALDKLIDDLGSLDDAIAVARTFAATLSWRATQISRAIADGRPQSVMSVIQDLRNGAVMVGAEALVHWCRHASLALHEVTDAEEITRLANGTHLWLESWLASWPSPMETVDPPASDVSSGTLSDPRPVRDDRRG